VVVNRHIHKPTRSSHFIMPFRERAKRLFRSKSRSDSLSQTSTNGSDRDRWPSNVYKPGEPMPRPKYRAPPQKEHKEKLEAFSFADAWRKRSFQSNYSPMGTRAPSRRASFLSRKSIGGRSTRSARKSVSGRSAKSGRTASITSEYTEKTNSANKLDGQPEAEGDDDVGNGLSSPDVFRTAIC
jgi:hypothetical protein